MNLPIIHPLILKESSYYDNPNGKTSIEAREGELTVTEMIGVCKFNIAKYKTRKDKKGQLENDLKKLQAYEAYLNLLLRINSSLRDLTVKEAYKASNMKIVYRDAKEF